MSAQNWSAKLFSQRTDKGIVPALDGLRAISILLVMVGHLQYQLICADESLIKNNPALALFFHFAGRADLGVDIFFVISGYIITTRLLRETARNEHATFSLKNFYIRRVLRILPACYTYLISLFLLSKFFMPLQIVPGKEILAAGFFVWNFLPMNNWFLAHTWSLCVEEHFYLLWPPCLKLLKSKGAVYLALTAIVLAPFGRLFAYPFAPEHNFYDHLLPGSIDFLMWGALAAILEGNLTFKQIKAFTFRFGGHYFAMFYIFVLSAFLASRQTPPAQLAFTLSLLALAIVTFLIYVVEHKETLSAKLLNARPLTHIGVISYSLYLWQQLFINPQNTSFPFTPLLNFVFAVVAAELSYHTVESYFLSLRSKLKA